MWQRYTERARRAIFFAREEAARCGQHEVTPEHILLGLLRGPDCVAGRILTDLGVDLDLLRKMVLEQCPRSHGNLDKELALTDSSKLCLNYADVAAVCLGNNYIGTEHELLGILAHTTTDASIALDKCGVRFEAAVEAVRRSQNPPVDDAATKPEVEPAAS